jgi:hypothetical protein
VAAARRSRRKPFREGEGSLARQIWPKIIAPESIVRYKGKLPELKRRKFRIGYYGRIDGVNCVWLVNELGEYEQTWDQCNIRKDFIVEFESRIADFFGLKRLPFGKYKLKTRRN